MAAFPTVEVLNPEQLNEGKDIKTDVGLLMAVISKVSPPRGIVYIKSLVFV